MGQSDVAISFEGRCREGGRLVRNCFIDQSIALGRTEPPPRGGIREMGLDSDGFKDESAIEGDFGTGDSEVFVS